MDIYTLLLLACPVVMGAMMWMMMRPGSKSQDSRGQEEITKLRSEVDELRAGRQSGERSGDQPSR